MERVEDEVRVCYMCRRDISRVKTTNQTHRGRGNQNITELGKMNRAIKFKV